MMMMMMMMTKADDHDDGYLGEEVRGETLGWLKRSATCLLLLSGWCCQKGEKEEEESEQRRSRYGGLTGYTMKGEVRRKEKSRKKRGIEREEKGGGRVEKGREVKWANSRESIREGVKRWREESGREAGTRLEERKQEREEGGGLLSGNFLLVSSLPLKCRWEMRD